ncbi:MAG: hypothetical protein JWO48_1907, partial [Bryobacterales bacterium]|nr:hypothetical protein [Bryobacterales bacterium]
MKKLMKRNAAAAAHAILIVTANF